MKSVAAYHFETRPAEALPSLRERLLADASRRQLKGQILIATEGINLFVAGHDDDVDAFIDDVRAVAGGAALQVKVSHSDDVPFHRLLVKIKAQIIAFDDPRERSDVDPALRPAPRVGAQQLKTWLDEGRPLTLLDTRNDYEVRMGTFKGAKHLNVRHFRDFGSAFLAGRDALDLDDGGDVVLFCTGGIRCEKAAPFLQSLGVERVMQLDGGILRYFEECGAAHFDGECFVFDKRVGVDAELKPTTTVMCFRCRMPLSALDQQSPDYVYEKQCPHCVGSVGDRTEAADDDA